MQAACESKRKVLVNKLVFNFVLHCTVVGDFLWNHKSIQSLVDMFENAQVLYQRVTGLYLKMFKSDL